MMTKIFTGKLEIMTRYALIHPCHTQINLSSSKTKPLIGLLDTGASSTSLGQGIIDELNLFSNEYTPIYGVSGVAYAKIYRQLRVVLPNFKSGFLVDALCTGAYYGKDNPFNFIIGMDIIKLGDFTIDSDTKTFKLDFSKRKF